MQLCSVFPKSPVNVLSYFHNLKNNKKVIALKKRHTKIWKKKQKHTNCNENKSRNEQANVHKVPTTMPAQTNWSINVSSCDSSSKYIYIKY